MHPNTFLRTLWRNEYLPQVFVAMSFEPRFATRFDEVIKPAIEHEPILGRTLAAYKVDNSRTGDSILTDIVDGIAHSTLFLADVSVIDEGRYAEQPIRNGNVMYEVGIALACRSPSEVLLIRDDHKKFLFDVSTIPHLTVDFEDRSSAISTLRTALADRISETRKISDVRVSIASQRLTPLEFKLLKMMSDGGIGKAYDFSIKQTGGLSIPTERAVSALMSKGCIQVAGKNEVTTGLFYTLTPFGGAVFAAANSLLPNLVPDPNQ